MSSALSFNYYNNFVIVQDVHINITNMYLLRSIKFDDQDYGVVELILSNAVLYSYFQAIQRFSTALVIHEFDPYSLVEYTSVCLDISIVNPFKICYKEF